MDTRDQKSQTLFFSFVENFEPYTSHSYRISKLAHMHHLPHLS